MKNKEFFIVRYNGVAWSCTHPISAVTSIGNTYEELVQDASIRLAVGLPPKKDLVKLSANTYKAYLVDTKLHIWFAKYIDNNKTIWMLYDLYGAELRFMGTYSEFRKEVYSLMGLKLPLEKNLSIIYHEGNRYDFAIKNKYTVDDWNRA